MIFAALALSLAWPLYDPVMGYSHIRTEAFVRVPIWSAGEITGYSEPWRESRDLLPTATSVTYSAPDLPSKGVAYISVQPCKEVCCP